LLPLSNRPTPCDSASKLDALQTLRVTPMPSFPYVSVFRAAHTKNYDNNQYGIHGRRFNYLFHDNHVPAVKIEQTVGRGALSIPKGG
jgi:prepilin-type processing-associated H-X9-DG protein